MNQLEYDLMIKTMKLAARMRHDDELLVMINEFQAISDEIFKITKKTEMFKLHHGADAPIPVAYTNYVDANIDRIVELGNQIAKRMEEQHHK